MSEAKYFSLDSTAPAPIHNVHYDLEAGQSPTAGPAPHMKPTSVRSEASGSNIEIYPYIKRRRDRIPSQTPILHEECQITVVDFSERDMVSQDFGNEQFLEFLEKKHEDWVSCRWINFNSLSWDVIQALGKHKKLHRLAIEDLINTNNRTKVDWYADHTFIVLTLQKLVHLHPDNDDSDSDSDSDRSSLGTKKSKHGGFSKAIHNIFSKLKAKDKFNEKQRKPTVPKTNICEDNTVIPFFESSADDIELPILHRLSTPDTLLRRSCDASMLLQAIIDAIIDLAIPVTTAYQDVIGELELDVLTSPDIKQSKILYVITNIIVAESRPL
ncbi:hypothetical protein G7Y89_g4278 [Cudoniella acicularis]|uniref:Uncharacterized protein n=1 Tax=Cudoniella acicularis TaxID=354080 RepID=A0A8H4W4G1_9HELO|nr:hypothetical protein G7Y89_g4278 [Cudoniella acicularis]